MTTYRRIALFRVSVAAICSMIIACSSSPRFVRKSSSGSGGSVPSGDTTGETSTTVRPNTGKALLTLEGVASYYAHDFHGKLTSNGETFNMNDITAAHRTFPFGTKIRVTNLNNNKSVIVRVNDRGPYVDGRIIDLSLGAAKEIDLIQTGTARVRLEVMQWGDGK